MFQLTGVINCGVASGLDTLDWNLIPEPKSKSHILTGQRRSSYTHKMFSGLRSRCAIPLACMNCNAEATSRMISAAAASLKYLCSWIRLKSWPPLIWKNITVKGGLLNGLGSITKSSEIAKANVKNIVCIKRHRYTFLSAGFADINTQI